MDVTSKIVRGNAFGFTLIELLVVISIGALFAAVVPGYYERFRNAIQFKALVSDVIYDLTRVRMEPQKRDAGLNYFWFDVSESTFGTSFSEKRVLPADFRAEITSAFFEGATPNRHEIYFFPDGGSTGGTIVLARKSGGASIIEIDWLTGVISEKRHEFAQDR